jgi:hypothetical protein
MDEHDNEIEYLKILAVVNAIMTVGNNLISVMTQSNSPTSSDNLNKVLEALKDVMLPHYAEATKKKALEVRERIIKESTGGPIKIQVMGRDKNKRKR